MVAPQKIAGFVFVDGQEVASTLQCVHCNCHWVPQRGSGITRGFCIKCMGPVCGRELCNPCVPFKRKLEEGLPLL